MTNQNRVSKNLIRDVFFFRRHPSEQSELEGSDFLTSVTLLKSLAFGCLMFYINHCS